MATSAQTKAAALEGLDFIETEEDVKAVEAATLKIQSTFRGKKFRSKGGTNLATASSSAAAKPDEPAKVEAAEAAPEAAQKQVNKSAGQREQQSDSKQPESSRKQQEVEANELSKRVGNMQVQDNSGQPPQLPTGELPEDEAERAATKIQAGFKGYKTRKELEEGGKLPASTSANSRQAAPADNK